MGWTTLKKVSQKFFRTALLSVTLLPIAIDILRKINIDSFFSEAIKMNRISLLGALIYLMSIIICLRIMPHIIKSYNSSSEYYKWCSDKVGIINFNHEFSELLDVDQQKLLNSFPSYADYFPLEDAFKYASPDDCCKVCTDIKYGLINQKFPTIRYILSFMILIGIFMMMTPLFFRIIKAFGGE